MALVAFSVRQVSQAIIFALGAIVIASMESCVLWLAMTKKLLLGIRTSSAEPCHGNRHFVGI